MGCSLLFQFRRTLVQWIFNEELYSQPPLVRNKLAQVITAVLKVWNNCLKDPCFVSVSVPVNTVVDMQCTVQLEYPEKWPTFFHDLLTAVQKLPQMVDMFCRIMQTIDTDVISLEIHR